MSVEKFVISKESSSFTVIPNKVLQGLNYCLEALGLYVYLASLPPCWTFQKSHLQQACNIGEKKLDKLLLLLQSHALIDALQVRDAQGRFAHTDLKIYDGTHFNPIQNKDLENARAPYRKNRAAVTAGRQSGTINTILENKDNKEHKDQKLSCASGEARSRFDEFYDAYPKKRDRDRAENIWRKRKLDEKADLILADIAERKVKDQQWQDKQFVPYPSTYLNRQRWTDEIIEPTPAAPKPPLSAPLNQSKSTVRDWAPGNPDYDRFHGYTH